MRTGLHCNTTRNQAKLLDYYRRSGARVVKVMEYDPPTLDALKALGVTIIGRRYIERADLDNKAFIKEIAGLARGYPQVDYWEGFNEVFSDRDGNIEKYAQYEIDRMKALEAVGKKAAIGCFSTGTPDMVDWPLFRPALEYAYQHGHALALHEYAGPFMQWLCGENQWDHEAGRPKRVDDPCVSPTVEGWLTLRYRKAYKLFKTWGLGDLPFFITEGGIDDTTPRPGGQGNGYKDHQQEEWIRLHGDYSIQRRWYMWQVSHDKQCKGVVDFGWDDASGKWAAFDLSTDDAMRERIIAAEASLPAGHFYEGTPMPIPPPISDDDAMRAAVDDKQVVFPNPASGLQKAMARDGYALLTDELSDAGRRLVFQGAYKIGAATSTERIYASKNGGPVSWIARRPAATSPLVAQPEPGRVAVTDMYLEGIDVSRWQGSMDWMKAAEAGTRFAFLKASEGDGWIDPEYIANSFGAAASNIPFGPYHFYRNAIDPRRQAEHFAQVVKAGPAPTLPVALDLEDTKTPVDGAALSAFVTHVEVLLGRPIIYTGAWWVRDYLKGRAPWIGGYPLWLASYGPAKPLAPAPWLAWSIWQYTSEGNGSMFGARSAHIDRNRFSGSLAELLALKT